MKALRLLFPLEDRELKDEAEQSAA
jgi:hypothetical protein